MATNLGLKIDMTPIISVKKRDGQVEVLKIDKMHKMVEFACEGISGVSLSQVEMNSHIQFYDGITTQEIQEILIKSASNLITEETPNYQYVAARLMLFGLRKHVWGGTTPRHVKDIIAHNIKEKMYDKDLLSYYTDHEWDKINGFIKHDRDLTFTYAGIQQVYDKYLVQDRTTSERYETPQYAFILIAACLFKNYPKETKLEWVKRYYDAVSLHKLSLPTPLLAGLRTPTKQYASCVLLDIEDSLDSIFASGSAIGKYVAQRAGIGFNIGKMRAVGSSIRNGEVKHTGVIPFLKMYESIIGSCSQGGIRNGAATCQYPIWHQEIEDLVVLKNNQGTENNRVRHLDYSIGISKIFYERYMKDEIITLFSPHEVPELSNSFGLETFDALYIEAEKKRGIKKKKIKARELFHNILTERAQTGRIYINNVDHFNNHSSFNIQLTNSNLCQEISLPMKPLKDLHDKDAEIATCILSAVNLGAIKGMDDLEEVCSLAVRGLEEVIDFQQYPVLAAELSTKRRRSLGIGFTNLAYYFAKNKLKWDSDEARKLMHETTEALQFYLLKASNALAQEKGKCEAFAETKYAQGILPIDTYKKDIDAFANYELKYDWEDLRAKIAEFGLRHSTLTAQMPCESSSVTTNSTNGIEPPRSLIVSKKSKAGVIKIVVPEFSKFKNFYELLYDL